MDENEKLREAVRMALAKYREFHVKALEESVGTTDEYDNHLISQAQIEAAQRVLWMDR